MGEHRASTSRALTGSMFGHRFVVVVPAMLVPAVTARLPRASWEPPSDVPADDTADVEQVWRLQFRPGSGWQVQHDANPLTRAERLEDALERMLRGVESWAAGLDGDLMFVHAGVVAWHGRIILLPGPRLPGRTTLLVSLIRAGAHYLSDAYALLDDDGRVHAYPRPLPLLRPGPGIRVRVAKEVDPDSPALPIGLVARVAYHPAGWRVEMLTPGQAALALVSADACGGRRSDRLSAAARRAVRGATAIAGTRGEARDAVPRLLRAAATGVVAHASRPQAMTVDLRSSHDGSTPVSAPLAAENGVHD